MKGGNAGSSIGIARTKLEGARGESARAHGVRPAVVEKRSARVPEVSYVSAKARGGAGVRDVLYIKPRKEVNQFYLTPRLINILAREL